jgi:hypothetical protein
VRTWQTVPSGSWSQDHELRLANDLALPIVMSWSRRFGGMINWLRKFAEVLVASSSLICIQAHRELLGRLNFRSGLLR